MISRKARAERGSIVLEGAMALAALFTAVGVHLEIARHAVIEVMFHQAAFLEVRARALGESRLSARARAERFLRLGPRLEVRHLEIRTPDGLRVKLSSEYRQLIPPFPYSGGMKHNEEITTPCSFFFSSR